MSAYREAIVEHYKNPMNHHKMENADAEYEDLNPVCGDKVHVWIKVNEDDTIEDISFLGEGCAISQAATSMLTDELPGMTLTEVDALNQEEIKELLGVPLSPVRLKCALLGVKVIQGAVLKYKAEKN